MVDPLRQADPMDHEPSWSSQASTRSRPTSFPMNPWARLPCNGEGLLLQLNCADHSGEAYKAQASGYIFSSLWVALIDLTPNHAEPLGRAKINIEKAELNHDSYFVASQFSKPHLNGAFLRAQLRYFHSTKFKHQAWQYHNTYLWRKIWRILIPTQCSNQLDIASLMSETFLLILWDSWQSSLPQWKVTFPWRDPQPIQLLASTCLRDESVGQITQGRLKTLAAAPIYCKEINKANEDYLGLGTLTVG